MRIRSHGTHYWYSSVVLGVWKLRPLERPGGLLRLLWQRQQAQQPLRHGHGQRRDQGIVVNNASNCGNSKPIILNSFTSQNYDHQNDGTTQQLAGCLRDFRNKPFPVKAKIEYFKNVLTVSTKWTCCFIDIRQWFFLKKTSWPGPLRWPCILRNNEIGKTVSPHFTPLLLSMSAWIFLNSNLKNRTSNKNISHFLFLLNFSF